MPTGRPVRSKLAQSVRSIVEALEQRTLMVTHNWNWVGPANGDWGNAANWGSSDAPAAQLRPDTDDNVTVPASAGTITAGNPQMGNATINANLTLTPAASMFVGSNLTMNGTLTLTGGGQFVTRCVFPNATGTLGGSGNITFVNGGGTVGSASSLATLTIGAGITIQTGASGGSVGGGTITSNATMIANGSTLTIDPVRFINRGSITLNSGFLRLNSQTWSNQGTMSFTGGTFVPGGTYRQADFGNYTRTGGIFDLIGTFTGNMALNSQTGSWSANNVTLRDGRYTATDGASFEPSGATLNNYILASDLTFNGGGGSFENNVTLEGTTLRLINATLNMRGAGPSTIGGIGTIQFTNGTFSQTVTAQQLTFDSDVSMRTVSGNATIGGNNNSQRVIIKSPLAVTTSGQSLSMSVGNIDLYSELSLVSGANLFVQGSAVAFNILGAGSIFTGGRTRFDLPRNFNIASTNPGRTRAPGTINVAGGTAAAPLTIEVSGADRGPVADGFRENYAMGVLRLNGNTAHKRLVDAHDNSLGAGGEALYVDSLYVQPGGTLDLNGLKLYARTTEIAGAAIVNGTVTLVPDGGPIVPGTPVSGRISAAAQVDDWTFFGRAGQLVSVVMNPSLNSSSSAAGPLNPILDLGRLSLISPTGANLGTVQSVINGSIVTLSNIALPTDGTYTLRMQASTGAPNNTGHYKLSLYDVSVDTRPLVLNTPTNGNLEQPFSSDKWTFSLAAGQQIQFDLLAADVSGLQFTLEGPNGYIPFSNLTVDSGVITIPPGNGGGYVLTVRGSADQSGAYRFVVRDGAVTDLPLGTTFAGTIPGSGSPRWFKTNLSQTGQLLVTLDDFTNTNRNQLYVRKGAPPTREVFDYRYQTYDADEQIYIPNATPGDWYVFLYSDHAPVASNYTLKAEFSELRITASTPDRYGVDNTMTMTLTGGGFEPGTVVKLVGGATTLVATSVEVDSSTQITATFDLAGAPLRDWDLVVERASLTFTKPAAFKTLANLPAKLETKLVMPFFPTRTSVAAGRVEFANTGNVAMPAPLFIVQGADPEGDQFPILSMDLTRTIENFWASTLPPGTSHRLMMLGSGAVPGILNPGERMSIPYNYLGEKAPFEPTDESLELELLCVAAAGTECDCASYDSIGSFDWSALKSALQPPSIPNAIWDEVYATITDPLDSVDDYAAALVANAQYLGRAGVRVVDIDEIWNFQVQQALGTITAFPTLASSLDAQLPAPGDPLSFTRRFADGVISRNVLGPFGYGWSSPWHATLSRDANNNIVTINSGSGGQRVFVRDARGSSPLTPSSTYFSSSGDSSKLRRIGSNVFELRDTDGAVTRFRSDGKLDFVQDANGNRTTLGYNGEGRLVTLTHSSGGVINLGYNGAGRIESLTDSLGRSLTYSYDSLNQHLLAVSSADGSTVSYTYDTASTDIMHRYALLSETVAGTTLVYTYDARGRVASSFVAGGAQPISLSYNFGRITLTDAAGSGQFYFDHQLQLTRVTNALGFNSRMVYDENGRLTKVILPDESQQRYDWCDCGSLISSTNELGQTVKTTRDPVTRDVTSITDAKGNVSRFTYDAAGNQIALVHPDGTSEYASSYTASGLPQAFTTRGGKTTGVIYNARGQVTKRTAPDGTVTDYVYDARGRLSTITQGAQVITRSYDTANDGDRLKRITYPGGKFVEYDYDSLGRHIAERDQTGFTTRFDYDSAGRMWRLRDTAGATLTSHTFDSAGRLTRTDNANGTFTTYGYDPAGNVLSIENWRSAGVINSKFIYTYDKRGRRTSALTIDGTWTYGYDPAGQLTSATFASTSAQVANQNIQISYDAAGNRTFATINGVVHDYVTNSLNQYTQVDGVDFTYDADGNLLSDGTRQFTYNQFNRLSQVQSGTDTEQFEYNALGNRTASIVNGVRTDFLVAPDLLGTVLAEFDAVGAVTARNIFDNGLVARTDAGGNLGFFDFDIIGSTAGVTNASGAYANRYVYDPFGTSLFTNESINNPYEFTGELGGRGGLGGLTRMGFRDYAADIGRFTTVDPLRLNSDVNTYRYAGNSPTMKADPTGLFAALGYSVFQNGVRSFETSLFGDTVFAVGVDGWQGLAVSAQTGSMPSTSDALWGHAVSFTLNAGFSLKGFGGFANGIQVALNPEVNQHFVNAACGVALQREFGTINIGAAKQLAALEAESGGAGPSTVNAACLEGFPKSGDANMGFGARCGYGSVSLAPRPLDPNDKIPPKGFGPDNRVPIEDAIEYKVDYENLGPGSEDEDGDPYPVIASVPAQRVAIDDQLSPNLDWSTVQFTEFAFGDTIVPVTDGLGSFSATIPAVTNGVAFVVQIDASVDIATGVLSVIFQAIDPTTGLPPNPMVGVVQPEDGSGNGKGLFKFSVKPVATVPDGTAIRNVAIIQFDANDVIPTNQIDPLDPSQGTSPAREALVTIDSAPPEIVGAPQFIFDAPSPRVAVQFNEDVSPSLAADDLIVVNLTTPGSFVPTAVSFDTNTNTATFVLPITLADGNYELNIRADDVADGVGRQMTADISGEFFHFAGDANHDRSININDFAVMASRFNLAGTFSQGDFNYSGSTEIGDFAILASKFNKTLTAARLVENSAAQHRSSRQGSALAKPDRVFAGLFRLGAALGSDITEGSVLYPANLEL